MGFMNSVKGQFLDVVEFEDISNKLLVWKFQRAQIANNEIKQGSKIIVREGQMAAFVRSGQLADVMSPGTYTLNTKNFPILSSLGAFPFLFTSPVISDVYFISTRQFIGNTWGTKNPVLKRDRNMQMVRIRAFGQFSFRVIDVTTFMRELFGSMGIYLTYDVIHYLKGIISETFATIIGNTDMGVLDLATQYRNLSGELQRESNIKANRIGIEFSDVVIENVSLPDNVEKLIDEQSGIGLAKQDMATYMQYQTARAMRDAAKQKGGLAGLGAGMALGNNMIRNINDASAGASANHVADELRRLKELCDEGIITEADFEAKKKQLLGI
ncbi:MAG: SPFH domain-containing protein [Lachnospiraceae bacterium]|nr:SPFH domain-containing protein [Lachnospiraceae bacterium]